MSERHDSGSNTPKSEFRGMANIPMIQNKIAQLESDEQRARALKQYARADKDSNQIEALEWVLGKRVSL